jgi:CRP/FNR family transcriptional regulator
MSHGSSKLNAIKSIATYPKSTILFMEGQQPRGVFVFCAGKAKLFASSGDGETIIT